MNFLSMKPGKRYWRNLIPLLVIVINAGFLLLIIFSAYSTDASALNNKMNAFFNSDSFHLAHFFKDIFIDKVDIKGYHTATYTLLFPTVLSYFTIMSIFRNPIVAIIINGLLQFSMFLILFFWLQKTLKRNISALYYIISGLSVLLFLIYLYNDNINTTFTSWIFLPYHIGALLNTYLCLILVLKFFETNRIQFLLLNGLFIIISCFSDQIFIAYYIIPSFALLIVLLIFSRDTRRITLISLAVMAVSLLIGHLLFRLLIISKYLFVTPGPFLDKENIVRGTKIMLLQYLDIIKAGGFNRFIIVYFLLSIALTFYLSIRIVIKNLLNKEKEEQNESIYILFSCIFLFTVFLTPALSGRYYAGDCIRYNILVFIVALANWGIILRRVLYKLKLEKQVLYSACCLLLLCSITFLIIAAININPPTQTLNYKPDVVKAILYVDSKNNLKNGVGTYWNAKLASVLLGKSKRLYQVIQNIRPDYLINNPNVYYHINRKNSSPPVFNYIVDNSNDIDTSVISKLFSGQQKIIYNFNNIVIFKVPDFIFTGVNEPYVKLLD